MENCHLNIDGFCRCYQKKCETVKDCAPKLIVERNMKSVYKTISNG